MIMMLFFLLLVVIGIGYLFAHFLWRSSQGELKESPMEILKRRYANGELDAEEFARRKKDLEA